MTRAVLLAPLIVALLAPPFAARADDEPRSVPTEVTEISATPSGEALEVEGTAAFGGQPPVWVAEDPPGDGPAMMRTGDHHGVDETGLDLLGARMSVPDPEVPELVLEWRVTNLPETGIPEGTRTGVAFAAGGETYRVQAKASNLTGTTVLDDPQGHAEHTSGAFQLLGDCAPLPGAGLPSCHHLAWLDGDLDPPSGTISVRVPLGSAAAPQIAPGAALRPTGSDAPELADVLAGYHAGASATSDLQDEASFGPGVAFDVPAPQVTLGVAPAGTAPAAVAYDTPATLAADGTFTGTVTAGAGADVYARACFGTNCGYRSAGGQVLTGEVADAVLRLPDRAEAFWPGGLIGNRLQHSLPAFLFGDPGVSSCDSVRCFHSTLRVDTPGAARLRIAIDAARRTDEYLIEIETPDEETITARNSNSFNRELFIEDPLPGTYGILVRPFSAANTSFGLRAKLEAEIPVPQPDADGLLLPDLQPTPPYEFGFAAPVNPANGPFLAPDEANPPASAAGVSPVSCSPDDTVDEGVVRCLRFSFGLSNVGQGNFHIRWNGFSAFFPTNLQGPMQGPMFQCVDRPGGEPLGRPAGSFEYHPSHFHTHYQDIVLLELLRVTDPGTGAMEPAGDGRKIGYSPADQGFGEWFRFDQARQGSRGSAPNCVGLPNSLGMSAGWGDVYRYQRAGNFVNFGLNPDGRYVVRLTVDDEDNVLEADDGNNTSYTYIRVTGDAVEVLEQGRGQSPWDPAKDVRAPRYRDGVPW